jgi:tRNA dimethylallyltransferase
MEVITQPVLVLIGPTAVGKTELSIAMANEFNCEIVSVDSMQVYRYMDIGTAKPDARERGSIAHHLIDIVDPDDEYNAARFCRDCLRCLSDIHLRGRIPLLTGGTGLYLKSLRDGLFPVGPTNTALRSSIERRVAEEGSAALHLELEKCDPISAARIMVQDKARIIRALEVFLNTGVPLSDHLEKQAADGPTRSFTNMMLTGITCDREELYGRINQRAGQMLDNGLEQEVRGLLARGYHADLQSMRSIGYRHMVRHIEGDWNRATTMEMLSRDTRRYAKRQFTWFNKMKDLRWYDRQNHGLIFTAVGDWLRGVGTIQ